MSDTKLTYEQLENRIEELEAKLRDCDELKKIASKQKESEARYKAMFYENKSVMILIDPVNKKIVDANDSAVKYYGYPKKKLISMDISELNILPEEEVEREIEKALNENRNYFQFKHKLSSGEIRDVQVYSGKIMFEDKELLYSIIHDNTNEIHAKYKLREQNEEYLAINEELEESLDRIRQATEDLKTEKLKAEINESKAKSLLAAIPDMMFIFSKEGIITDYHAERNTDLYIKPEVFLNKKVDDVLPAPLPELTHTVTEKVLRTGETQEYNYELDMKGEKRYFNARMVMLSATKTMSIVRDITDSKRAQQELLKAKEKAEESDRLKSAFLANMSHEIRTPMNGIIGFSEMLMSPNLTEERRNYFSKIIIDSSRQLLNIVNDILDISMIESDSIKVKKEEVVVNDVIMDLYAFFKPQSKNKTIALHTYTPLPDRQSIVITDKDRVKQVISNLLNNALKFTHEGYIKFGYKLVDNQLQFFVEDTGIGIAKDQLTNIFERFRQEDLELTRQYGGTGLGLSISQKLAELLGGTLWVESEKGKGSVFYFTVPYQAVVNETGETTEIPSPEENEKLTILIAEDEEVNHLYIQELLTGMEVNLIHARDGNEAVEMCRQHPAIGLILMDIKMPLMNGYEATKEIKKFRPELPIIAQTAYAMTEDREKVLRAGCDGYLSKPINVAELLFIIEQYKK